MRAALALADASGMLRRRPGGSWCALNGDGSVLGRTVKALVARGLLRYISPLEQTVELVK